MAGHEEEDRFISLRTTVETRNFFPKSYNMKVYKDGELSKLPDYELDDKNEKEYENNEIKPQGPLGFESKLNTRALPKFARTYKLEDFEKNAMIIFNNIKIEGFLERKGTVEDETALRKTFSKFNFEIEPHMDLTKDRLFDKLKAFSEKDFTDYGCVAVVVMTHGTNDGLLRAQDEGQFYSELDIIKFFKAHDKPTLVTKPVLIIIQACRGTGSTNAMPVMQAMKMYKDHEDDANLYHLPVEADVLVVHSCYVGKPSYRPEDGSWFIQTLCKCINEYYGTHDLESIMTEVKMQVSIDKYHMERYDKTGQMQVGKQMPITSSTLIRKLYLRKYQDLQVETFYDSLTSPNTPRLLNDSYSYILAHFKYMKKCLWLFAQENPNNRDAHDLLTEVTLENGENEERAKALLINMSKYLQIQCKHSKNCEYIYFYEETKKRKTTNTLGQFINAWVNFSKNNIVRGFGVCIGAVTIYKFVKK